MISDALSWPYVYPTMQLFFENLGVFHNFVSTKFFFVENKKSLKTKYYGYTSSV